MTVVVGVNLSEHSDEALRQGDAWARAHGWKLRACHVAPEAHPKLDQALRRHVAELTGRSDVETAVEVGAPDAVLVHQAAQLLVVGSHSYSGLKQLFLGDVAESVIRHAWCSVLVARPHRRSGRILVATDLSEEGALAVELAAEHAEKVNAQLLLVSSIERQMKVVRDLTSFGAAYGFVENEYENARISVEKRLRELAPRATVRVLEGAAAPAILHAAGESDAELVVIAYGKRRLRPGVPEKVAATAPCSVLVARPPLR